VLAGIASRVSRLSDGLNQCVKWICVPTALGFILIMLVQIFIRFVLGGSIAWSLEMIQILFFWAVFTGVSISWKNRMHIVFSFIVERLPKWLNLPVAMTGHISALVFFIYVVGVGFQEFVALEPNHFEVLEISENWSQLPIPISGALMIVHTLDQLLQEWLTARQGTLQASAG
jgi:TRAP-type C4-dicarboxylate transport system permease small subunit